MRRFAGQRGWYCLGYIDGDPDLENLNQEWYFFPRQWHEIAARYAELAARQFNLYGSVCLFSARKRSYKNALPSPWLWADDVPAGTVCTELIRTSEHKRQALAKLSRPLGAEDRKRLQTYWRDRVGADACSTDAVHMMRIPGGYNRKRHGCYLVEVEQTSEHVWNADRLLEKAPPLQAAQHAEIADLQWPEVEAHLANIDALLNSARALCIKPDSQTGRILAGERVAIASARLGRMDDSSSAQGAILAYGFYCRGFLDDEIAAVVYHFYQEWGVVARKGSAWCKADIGRCIALAHEKKPDVVQSATRYRKAAEAQPITDTPARSRARRDRPTRFDPLMLFNRYKAEPALCELPRKGRAASLEISTATLDRLEDALETEGLIEIQTAGKGLPGRVILQGSVINIGAEGVLSKDDEAPADEAARARTESGETAILQPQCIGETHTPPEAPQPPAAPPSLLAGVKRAIRAIEQEVIDPETGAFTRFRANPDRVRAWLSERYPGFDTTDVEAVYPEARKAVQAARKAAADRAFWDGERARVRSLDDGQLLVALRGEASKLQNAEQKKPGSPWAKRCAAIFGIHDDERRRRGLALESTPDRGSRKAATARTVATVQALSRRSRRDEAPSQRSFASAADDLTWLPAFKEKTKRQRAVPADAHQGNPAAAGAPSGGVCSPQPTPGTRESLMASIRAIHERRQAGAP